MESSFFFALLRISIAQIIKAAGFDRCEPSILNTLTEIYIQHLKLVVSKSLKYCEQRTNSINLEIQDVTQALLHIGFIKPDSFESILDTQYISRLKNCPDEDANVHKDYNTKSADAFENWVEHSEIFATSKKLSEVPHDAIKALIEKRKIDDSNETDQDKKKRKLREKQQYYNQFKSSFPHDSANEDEDLDEAKDVQISWLGYLAEKEIRLGQGFKFLHTALEPELMPLYQNESLHPTSKDIQHNINHVASTLNKNDHILLALEYDEKGGDPADSKLADPKLRSQDSVVPPPELVKILPYNLAYDPALTGDSFEEFIPVSNHLDSDHSISSSDDPNPHSEIISGNGTLRASSPVLHSPLASNNQLTE